MTFEELEADWDEWLRLYPIENQNCDDLFRKSPVLAEADYRGNHENGTGVCIVAGCIMLPF